MRLAGLRWHQRWVAQLGCAKGCLAYLGVAIDWPWLYGGTGHAFVVNAYSDVGPAGPTCWGHQALIHPLAPNLGYRITEGVNIERQAAGDRFAEYQQAAWDFTRRHLDAGHPCFGWELCAYIPDYHVINGYDEVGYYYSGWTADDVGGPRPWQELGTSDVQVLQVYAVERCPAAGDDQTVRQALAAALRLADDPADLVFEGFRTGPAAFATWSQALRQGTAQPGYGHSYNLEVWHECRAMAVLFLQQVAERVPSLDRSLLAEATHHYATVRDALAEALVLDPFEHDRRDWPEMLQSDAAADLIDRAGAAETAALAAVRRLL